MDRSGEIVDLTHALNAQTPTWGGSCGFKHLVKADYSESHTHTKFLLQGFEMNAGVGTHMDAPIHCFKGGMSISDIPVEQFILPLIVLDVSKKADAHFQIDSKEIHNFEKAHGKIPKGSLVIAHTGWSQYWQQPARYRNADNNGVCHFPSFHGEVAEILFDRGVSGVAIDTLSPDLGLDGTFPMHELFLGNRNYLIENVANTHLLPPVGATGIVLPMKIEGAAEAPVRFIAFL